MASETLDITEARSKFTTLDRCLQDSPVIWITRHNKPAFAVVNSEMMETLLETLEIIREPESLRLLEQSLQDIKNGNMTDHDDLKQEMESW